MATGDASDVFGEPDIRPRVGEEYQVEIPPYTENRANRTDSWDSYVGLDIPLRWANQGGNTTKKLDDSSQIASSSRGPESSSDIILEDGKLRNVSIEEKQPSQGSCLVPDDVPDPWTNAERKSFLLALYIFGKNFVHVKGFVQTKKTSDIMAYYYGEFYGSDDHRRWSDGRKVRSKKFGHGQKLFIGSRLQELLSRLLPNISAECQRELLEIFRKFGEGKIPLQEYVLTLKRLVGINTLIEAVGIGKGKQDLTSMAFEPTKSNHASTMRSEMPFGKACSSLTPNEIIKYLTGSYRLSKARSNDLFWEAVWPLLLARGWHSEEPKNMAYAGGGSKQNLVFLMPDVKKFSRKLVKGTHYFDSVTDVLSKVASDPKLIDFDTEDHEGNKNQEENEEHNVVKVESDDLPTPRCHSYLQPKTPNQCTDDMEFTVVDTSLCGGKPYKVRDLKSLSLEISRKLSTKTHSEDTGKDRQKVSIDIPDSADTVLIDPAELIFDSSNTSLPNRETSSSRKDLEVGATNRKTATGKDSQKVPTDIPDSADTMLIDPAELIFDSSNTSLPNRETSSSRKDLEVGAINRKMATGKDSQKVPTDIPDSADAMLIDPAELIFDSSNTSLPNRETSSSRKDLEVGATNRKKGDVRIQEVHASILEGFPLSNAMNNVDLPEDVKSRKVKVDIEVPTTKRRRGLNACSRTETNNTSCVPRVELVMPSSCSSVNNIPASNALQIGSFQDKMSSTSSSESSPSVSTECAPVNNFCVPEVSPVEPQPRILIDLNVLPASADSENGQSLTETTEEQTNSERKPESSELQVSKGVGNSDQQQPPSMMSSRRQGTRNRPPTTRALEALANGFLTVNRRQKNREAGPRQNLGSKSSQQTHGGTKAAESGNNSEFPPPDGNGGTTSGS